MAEKYMELYKVEEIPSYRYCVYRRRDPSVSQIDARTDRGTYIEKLEEVRQDPTKKLENIRSVMAGWKVKGKVRFVEWVADGGPRPRHRPGQPRHRADRRWRPSSAPSSAPCSTDYREDVRLLKK